MNEDMILSLLLEVFLTGRYEEFEDLLLLPKMCSDVFCLGPKSPPHNYDHYLTKMAKLVDDALILVWL